MHNSSAVDARRASGRRPQAAIRLGAAPDPGVDPDFIPNVLQEAIDAHLYDEVTPIAGAEGTKWAKALAQKEGIFTGISGGSTSPSRERSPRPRPPARSSSACFPTLASAT